MNVFKTLFGVDASFIRSTCVLTPFVTKDILDGFGIGKMPKGVLYSVGNNENCSMIYTGMGSVFLGDAVLYLKDTNCKNMILFGSCGAVKDNGTLGIGNVVAVKEALSQDSFVNMLLKKKAKDIFYPDKSILEKVSNYKNKFVMEQVNCLTVGSLKLEEDYTDYLKNESIDIVDMETSAFYAAAEYAGKKAVSVLFVTDILRKYPFYVAIKPENRQVLGKLTNTVAKLVNEIVKEI